MPEGGVNRPPYLGTEVTPVSRGMIGPLVGEKGVTNDRKSRPHSFLFFVALTLGRNEKAPDRGAEVILIFRGVDRAPL